VRCNIGEERATRSNIKTAPRTATWKKLSDISNQTTTFTKLHLIAYFCHLTLIPFIYHQYTKETSMIEKVKLRKILKFVDPITHSRSHGHT